ncbi:MAG: hypothetical protein M9937_12610 [Chelatococcus sp.]|uniref:hypothetical protein n=1 Tax=Chelatococcus sp. TaxID=1953771 RepID=UPI00224BC107|nr:hypothetical protein [Chelatococcus sp.]MCO5076514.1 hypothetical protein [Chelatococcus sp.]CAH1675394.1 hypothetical protein CHELA41_24101 [Hyphomicrobiales bacterium]
MSFGSVVESPPLDICLSLLRRSMLLLQLRNNEVQPRDLALGVGKLLPVFRPTIVVEYNLSVAFAEPVKSLTRGISFRCRPRQKFGQI